ncbi:MAG: hypothetical protein CFE45_43135, partial [Burkholderiales bacterium PBB5]
AGKPAEAARLGGMPEDELRTVNNIPKGMLVKAGSTLLVPRGAHRADDVTEHVAEHAMLALAPERAPGKTLRFKAGKKGDTVAAVAKRYKLNATQVAEWNHTTANGRFKAGETVTVVVPAKAQALALKPLPKGSTRVAAKSAPARRLVKPGPVARSRSTCPPGASRAPRPVSAGRSGRAPGSTGPRTPARCPRAHHAPGASRSRARRQRLSACAGPAPAHGRWPRPRH